MQTLPLGCPPHTPMHHGNYQPMVQVEEGRALRQKERLTTTVPQEAGGAVFYESGKYKLHNTDGLQIVKH